MTKLKKLISPNESSIIIPCPVSNQEIMQRQISLSNWSLAEEIKRLIENSTLGDLEVKYNFHKENCANSNLTPFGNPKSFHKKGVSSSNSQKYQCIECKKNTNVLPSQRRCYTYNQRRNDILPKFAHQILGRTPVKRTIDILNIGSSTYYNKLEWLFRKCLEFLEKHETKALKNKKFDRLWLNTDKLNYYLNNARKKGHGSDKSYKKERPMFPTAITLTDFMLIQHTLHMLIITS